MASQGPQWLLKEVGPAALSPLQLSYSLLQSSVRGLCIIFLPAHLQTMLALHRHRPSSCHALRTSLCPAVLARHSLEEGPLPCTPTSTWPLLQKSAPSPRGSSQGWQRERKRMRPRPVPRPANPSCLALYLQAFALTVPSACREPIQYQEDFPALLLAGRHLHHPCTCTAGVLCSSFYHKPS